MTIKMIKKRLLVGCLVIMPVLGHTQPNPDTRNMPEIETAPPGDPPFPVPFTGVEWLLLGAGALGINKIVSKRKK